MNKQKFQVVGAKPLQEERHISPKKSSKQERPYMSIIVLVCIIIGCLCAEILMTYDPTYMHLQHYSTSPNTMFYFGTDTMGRDIFSMIWYGGRISLYIGVLATMITTVIAIVYGAISGIAAPWIDGLMMRFVELLLSLPTILFIIFVQALIGMQTPTTIAIVIGITSWMTMAKMVRTEVRQMRHCEYVLASRMLGGRFFHILRKHYFPHFFATIMFMIVMNINSAIIAESTLSFLGIGLPVDVISWGSMLSLAQKALLTEAWWIIVIPTLFLITTLVCVTNIGHYIRSELSKKQSYL